MKYSKYPFYISQLIIKSLKGQLTEAEQEELDRWLTIEANRVLYLSLSRRNLDDKKNLYGQLHPERTWECLEKRLYLRKRSYFRNIIRYAAAVLLLAMISTAVYLYWKQSPSVSIPMVWQTEPLPGSARAFLVFASGETVNLEDERNFSPQQDSDVRLDNKDNTLTIKSGQPASVATEEYQTLVVPRGGEYKLVLEDGSRVYLNSNTKLHFPLVFAGEKRVVHLEGEAYFEVAFDSLKPFIVMTGGMEVQVLGTKFNIKAYTDDQAIFTTLVSGSVQIKERESAHTALLRPDEQCIYTTHDGRMRIHTVDPQVSLGWIHGRFVFENETLEEILKQLGRWYDVKIFFRDPQVAGYRFTGNVGRFDQISTLLRMIEKAYDISFTINDDTVIVSKK